MTQVVTCFFDVGDTRMKHHFKQETLQFVLRPNKDVAFTDVIQTGEHLASYLSEIVSKT